jgi:hypothetical protein
MLKSGILFALLGLALTSCKDPGTGALPDSPQAFAAGFEVGEKRMLLKEFTAQGRTYGFDLFSIGEIEIEKDTVYQGSPGKIFTVTGTEFRADSNVVFRERDMLVAQGDSLNLYAFREGYSGFLFGLVKTGAFDTAVFSDKTTEWVVPLMAGAKWRLRPEGEGAWDIEKEWTGKESVTVGGKEYECDVFVAHSMVPLKTWIAPVGLVKAEILHEGTVFTDSTGIVDSVAVTLETYELLKLNPSEAEVAAAKEKYRSMTKRNLP